MSLVTPLDPRENPSFLKLDLYCKGARIHESCLVEDSGGRPLLRTRAGLGSGLELILPRDMWTNVPVVEDFAKSSPYDVRRSPGDPRSVVRIHHDGDFVAFAHLAPKPDWYERPTRQGKPMRRVGTLQGTYLGIYPAKVCEFWITGDERAVKENCRFCSVGLNLGADDEERKDIGDVMDTVHAAWRESHITYVDFNTGHYDRYEYLDILEPYIRRVKEETGLLIGVQTPPHPEREWYDRLRDIGVNRVSFCFEIFDPERFEEVCPGKARIYGLDDYLAAIEYCAGLEGKSALEPWVTNGEIIAGLESPETSIQAIEWLTERGAIPTVCVFRPLRGTDYAKEPPPRTEDMVPVFQSLYVESMRHGLPIGLAPNIHVSLVMLPEECRGLVQDEHVLRELRPRELKNVALRAAFAGGLAVRRGLRGPRPRKRVPAAPPEPAVAS